MINRFFSYTTGPVACPGVIGTPTTVIINIGADADFVCTSITGLAVQATIPAVWAGTVQIDDSGVGRTFFSAAVPFQSIAGTGQLPFVLEHPRFISRNSSLTITFNQVQAVATTVHLTLNGYKKVEGVGEQI